MQEKRRPGRPPNTEPNPDLARVDIRMSPELRRRVRMAAAKDDLSMGEWVRRLVERETADRERGE